MNKDLRKTSKRVDFDAKFSAKQASTEAKIIDAIGQLTKRGDRVTQASIGGLAGISQQTISKHYQHLLPPQK